MRHLFNEKHKLSEEDKLKDPDNLVQKMIKINRQKEDFASVNDIKPDANDKNINPDMN